jgi:toluene monooxygenase system protein E
MPSEYEVVSTRLHHHVARGLEVDTPLGDWYRTYQAGCPLACDDWEGFRDPRETTYTSYTALQKEKETYVDGLFRSMEDSRYDAGLSSDCIERLEAFVPPLRYPCHALQMIASYVGQMAPASRITIACAFQAADEMRRVQRLSYRMAMLRLERPAFGDEAKATWTDSAAWQPLRRLVERLLTTYDWGEAFAALSLCTKPLFDDFVTDYVSARAKEAGDYTLAQLFGSLHEDSVWHRSWARALVTHAVAQRPDNRDVLRGWVIRWWPEAESALAALDANDARGPVVERTRAWLAEMGVSI